MEMTLENFRNYVPAKIWHRGEDYYEDGAVAELEEVAHGEWHAVVEGSDDYHVEISLAGDRIMSYDCDCPAQAERDLRHEMAKVFSASVRAFGHSRYRDFDIDWYSPCQKVDKLLDGMETVSERPS